LNDQQILYRLHHMAWMTEHLTLGQLNIPASPRPRPNTMLNLLSRINMIKPQVFDTSTPNAELI
jgi:hypothetical protein